jgi:uncharacterized protein YqeY
MSLKERITEDMKAAMRAKDAPRLGAIRMLTSAIRQKEIDERIDLGDAETAAIVEKLIKQRRDSIGQFETAGRTDLVAVEKAEIEVLSAYLPQQLSDAEIDAQIAAEIARVAEAGAAGPQAIGKVMGALKQRLAGKADMAKVAARVKAGLSAG